MGKRIQIIIWILLGITICTFVGILLKYWWENRSIEIVEEEKKELVILSTYETRPCKEALQELVDKYTLQQENISVRLKFVLPADFQKEISMEKDAENLSDIIICDNVMTPALVSMGIFEDLSEYMNPQKSDEYLDVAYNTTLINGKPYSVPLTCDPYVLFYNEDYFKKNDAKIPSTLEEFYKILKSVQTLGNYNFGIACKNDEDIAAAFLQMIYLCGGNIRDLNGSNSILFYKIMQDFRDSNVISQDIVNWNQQDLMHYFSEGMVVTAVARLSSVALLKEENMDFSYKIMEIPYEQNQSYLFHGENVGITVGSSEEAKKLLNYLTDKETLQAFYTHTAKLSVCVDIQHNPAPNKGISKEFIQKQRYNTVAKSSYSSWFMISSTIADHLMEFITNTSIDAYEAADSMQISVREAILER